MCKLLQLLILLICLRQAQPKFPHTSKLDQFVNPMNGDFIERYLKGIYGSRLFTPQGPSNLDSRDPLILTPYIIARRLKEARKLAFIDPLYTLPGVVSYSGYLTVNKEMNSNLWFWYFPVAGNDVKNTPWILWLQGEPGVSSLYGLFNEIGPFTFACNDGGHLREMPYSWSKNHSLLFIDSPVGTGFSFSDGEPGKFMDDEAVALDLYTALVQFLVLFPELRTAPLTIAGKGYAGKPITMLAVEILRETTNGSMQAGGPDEMSFHGVAIGNGFLDPFSLMSYHTFAREIGIIDVHVARAAKKYEDIIMQNIANQELLKAFEAYNILLQMIAMESRANNLLNYVDDDAVPNVEFLQYIKHEKVRRMLNVGYIEFKDMTKVFQAMIPTFMSSVLDYLEELLDYRAVLLYSGQLDVLVPYQASVGTHSTLHYRGAFNLQEAERWPWYHDHKLAGYFKKGGNLLEVMVRNAGYMVAKDRPSATLGLISAFVRGQDQFLKTDTSMYLGADADEELSDKKLGFRYACGTQDRHPRVKKMANDNSTSTPANVVEQYWK